MKALGDRPAADISTREVNQLLREIAAAGVAPRTVNKARQLLSAIFNYGMKPSTWELPENPVTFADRRREPKPGPLPYFSVEQVEALARAFESGAHRDPRAQDVGSKELQARAAEDRQDAELVRVAAYSGLRRGELVTLRWRDVQFLGRKVIVSRTLSADVEATSTKSGRFREVPLPDQAAGALDRLSQRDHFTGPDEYVFCNCFGRRLDPSALRRRYERARDAAQLPALRFHDLRHTYGSLLVDGGIDLISVKAAMGHSQISTTERYLHARPATELAQRFTAALDPPAASRSASVTMSLPSRLVSAEAELRKTRRYPVSPLRRSPIAGRHQRRGTGHSSFAGRGRSLTAASSLLPVVATVGSECSEFVRVFYVKQIVVSTLLGSVSRR